MRKLRSAFATLLAIASAASACATANDDDSAPAPSEEDELRLCRPFAPTLADRTVGKAPLLASADVEVAATLEHPPGNVAIDADGRMFVSFFPDTNHGSPKVALVMNGRELEAFPNATFQRELHTVLGIRLDRHGRLWILDHGSFGLHRPKLYAFDARTRAKVQEITFGLLEAPPGSMLNDVQIAPDGKTVYVSDASYVAEKPGLLVVDLANGSPKVRRVLHEHPSVMRGKYNVMVDGKKVRFTGVFCAGGGIDGIALDSSGENLYYAPLNSGDVWRVPTHLLRDFGSSKERIAGAVQKFADATMTDGMVTDAENNVYLTDMEHSSVVRVRQDRSIEVVARDPRLRWPDGFAWAPDGSLFVTASALHVNLPELRPSREHVARGAPYHVLRLARACSGCSGAVGQ